MTEIKKQLKLDTPPHGTYCDIITFKNMKLPMIMLQGWFNDQHECFRLFFQTLTSDEETHLFNKSAPMESVKEKYRQMYTSGKFKEVSRQWQGEHKQLSQLSFTHFTYWAACVSGTVREMGSLEALLESLGTVEVAHNRSKTWFARKTQLVRILNAADAARILARYGKLRPEERPLLARGSLRGAAILLNEEPPWKNRDMFEKEYQNEAKRIALEEKAATYINESREFVRFGKWKMEEGESWFCEEVHKRQYPERGGN